MLSIAICDDDKQFLNIIENEIFAICQKNELQYSLTLFTDGDKILFNLESYDLILLDIKMAGVSGLEIAERINKARTSSEFPIVVFITSRDNFVFDALKFHPYAFIRKQSLDKDLESCLMRVNRIVNKVSDIQRYVIKSGRNMVSLQIERIISVYKSGNYCIFVTDSGTYRERCKFDDKYNDLEQYGFIRTGIGCMVNISHIIEMKTEEIVMDNGEIFPVSKKYRKGLKEKYFAF